MENRFPFRKNEKDRVQAVRSYNDLDSGQDKDFDDIVTLASSLCAAPIAFLAIIDEKSLWIKSKTGIQESTLSREDSICDETIKEDSHLISNDLAADGRFKSKSWVLGEPFALSYAGAVIKSSEGFNIGTIAVLHKQSGAFNKSHIHHLKILSRQATNLLHLKKYHDVHPDPFSGGKLDIQEIFDRVSDAFIGLDNRAYFTHANKKASRIMGKKAEEVLGKSIWEIFPDSRNTPFYESCEKAKKNQQYQFLELFYPQFSRWFEIHIYPSITGLSIYFRDITKKKIIRERIIEAEKQYRHIFENALHGIFRSTPDWKLMTVNNYMAGLFGFSNPLEMVKSTQHLIRDLVPDPEKQAELEKLLEKDRFINAFELEMKGKNKPSSWVLLNINPIKDDSGKLTYYEGTIQDISAMKLATEQIRKEKEFSDSIINSLPGVFYLFTKEGSFLRWNKNFEIISGYNSQEVKNMHPIEFFEEKDRAYIQEKIEQVFEKGMVEVQASFFTKQQNKIPFYFNGWSTNIDGQPCLIGMGIDITDQRKSEMQLQEQNEELQQRNQELDHFVYSVSHDLRAPISSIKGILNIVNYEDIGNEVIQMCWEKIGLSINRLDNFINEVLDYSSNLRIELQVEKINFQKLVEETKNSLSLVKGFDRITFTLNLSGTHGFYSDRSRLVIIFNNLITNAIQFQDSKKPESRIDIDIKINKEQAIIIFEDNGIGIDVPNVERIFDMFYRASELSIGSGLGLYITKETVNRLSGSINVTTCKGEYSKFIVILPNNC